jgi:hypothetical protein
MKRLLLVAAVLLCASNAEAQFQNFSVIGPGGQSSFGAVSPYGGYVIGPGSRFQTWQVYPPYPRYQIPVYQYGPAYYPYCYHPMNRWGW